MGLVARALGSEYSDLVERVRDLGQGMWTGMGRADHPGSTVVGYDE
jgi:hypothetical protein